MVLHKIHLETEYFKNMKQTLIQYAFICIYIIMVTLMVVFGGVKNGITKDNSKLIVQASFFYVIILVYIVLSFSDAMIKNYSQDYHKIKVILEELNREYKSRCITFKIKRNCHYISILFTGPPVLFNYSSSHLFVDK